jgi:RecA/RadA recombinase
MSKLNELFNDPSFGEVLDPPTFRTGIDLLDYRNGRYKINEKTGKKELQLGFNLGKIVGFIGKPGAAKTTLALQIITNMMRDLENFSEDVLAFHYDFERSTNEERILSLSNNPPSFLNKYKKFNSKIYQESVHDLIMKIREMKLGKPSGPKTKNPGSFDPKISEEYLIQNPHNPKENILVPTFLFIDSISTMMPRDITLDENQGSNMIAAAIAKANANFFRKVVGDLGDTMTTLFYVNHLTTKISINPMQPVTANINYLDPNENMPGGRVLEFLTDILIKLKTGKKLKESEEFGITGFLVEAKFAKSRSNKAGVSCILVYSQDKGYSNVLSNFLVLKDANEIKGGGRGFFLSNLPSVKFAQKDVETLYETNEQFKDAFDALIYPILETYVPGGDDYEDPYVPMKEKFAPASKEKQGLSTAKIKKLPIVTINFELEDGSEEEGECYYDAETDTYYDKDTLQEI